MLSVSAACGGGQGGAGGPRSFDVTATLTVAPQAMNAAWSDFPRSHAFTLVLDEDRHLVFVGGAGSVGAAMETIAGSTHGVTGNFPLPVPFAQSCGGIGEVEYRSIGFSVEDGALQGTAKGLARYLAGDEFVLADMQATLVGTADVTPPTFLALEGPVDALGVAGFPASEPLPSTSTASLVGMASGDVVPLLQGGVHDVGNGDVVTGFFSPPGMVALRWDETYTMKIDGVVDFAGNAVPPAAAPTFKTRPAPPLVPEDGFESVTTPTLGGAGVLRGDPLTPITGTTSLILNTGFGGGFGFLPYMLGPSVALRLAVAPGDTVVRFQRRIVAVGETQDARFYGGVAVGALGTTLSYGPALEATDLVKVTLPQDGDVWVSGDQTIEVPLPPGVGDEVTFEITGDPPGCGVPPLPTALIIDDLRVE